MSVETMKNEHKTCPTTEHTSEMENITICTLFKTDKIFVFILCNSIL